MAVFRVSVDARQAERQLRLIHAGLSDLRSFWPAVSRLATSWFRRQFETEGGFAGSGWAALAPSTAAYKARLYPGKPILQATGAMKRAVSSPSRTQTPTLLVLTISDPKLGYHQEGTSRMPARPVIFGSPLPSVAAAELDEAAEDYVRDLLRRIL